jgi:hypothetical protein
MVGEKWKETTETHFVKDPNELRQDLSDQLQVPLGSILYQPVTVNIHYPNSCVWTEDVIADLKSYSAAEDKQGGLQVLCDWKDAVQSAISYLTKEDDVGVWNWDENHYLGNIRIFPLAWRTLLRTVYKTIGNGSPARDYILTGLYANKDQLRAAYGKAAIIDDYVETIFSDVQKIQKSGNEMMEMTATPHHDYPEKMLPLIPHHYSEKSKFFIFENITHYVRVIMFGCYNVETKNIIDALACGAVAFNVQASPMDYLTSRNLFDNELLVVTLSCTALYLATIILTSWNRHATENISASTSIGKTWHSIPTCCCSFSPDSCWNVHYLKVLIQTFKATQDMLVSVRKASTGMGIISCF